MNIYKVEYTNRLGRDRGSDMVLAETATRAVELFRSGRPTVLVVTVLDCGPMPAPAGWRLEAMA